MKKIIVSFILFACTNFAFAQNDFDKAMQEKISKMQATNDVEELKEIAYDFDQLSAKKDSWLPYYYASYSFVKQAKIFIQANKTQEMIDAVATANKFANIAKEKKGNAAEISILMKMIHSLNIRLAPEKNYKEENALGLAEINNATTLDPKNPRITLALADDLYYLPKEYGGNKEKAIQMYKTALEQFKTYKLASSLAPNWGKEDATQMLSELN